MKRKRPPKKTMVKKPARNYSAFQGEPKSPEEAALMVATGEVFLSDGSARATARGNELVSKAKPALALSEKTFPLTGGEIVIDGMGAGYLLDRTANPDQIAACASRDRLNLVDSTNCISMALDASESVKGANSLEKMLVHQMAAAHKMAMNLLAQIESTELCDDIVKMINASTRLMSTFQNGMATLAKVRTGGKQEVVVQHVHVNGDAQAVIAGKMDYPGGRGQRGGADGK